MALDAHAEWDKFGKEIGQPVLHRAGVVYLGKQGDPVIEGAALSAKEYSLPRVFSFSAEKELSRVFPGMKPLPNEAGLFEGGAGWVEAHTILSSLHKICSSYADLRYNVRVTKWESDPATSLIHVFLPDGEVLRVKKLVLCAGSWTSHLLADLSLSLHPKRRVLHWFEVEEAHLRERVEGPGFLATRGALHIYGFPAIRQSDGRYLVKAGFHYAPYLDNGEEKEADDTHDDADVNPDQMNRTVSDEEAKETEKFLRNLFEGIGKRVKSAVCLYTMTDDGHFVIDKHPQNPNVVIAAGFSGHGFKFGLTIGKILVSLAQNQPLPFDISPFSVLRPSLRKQPQSKL